MNELVEKTVEAFGSIRILIANAGVNTIYGPLECLTTEEANKHAKKTIGTNLIGTINTVTAVLPQMNKQQYGQIVTLSGGGAGSPMDNMILYSASKGGVEIFTKCLAVELEEKGVDIKINAFQPGVLKTNLRTKVTLVPDWKKEEEVQEEIAFVLEHLAGDIEERCKPVIDYVNQKCRKNGEVFKGYNLFNLFFPAIRMKRQQRKASRKLSN